ncbi:hypothetical protein C8J56DRAFT_1060001 [Mycena floridula]|nr:hypothetical protein C8J56DRAFT_1060001 [Mycena floridula]
MSSATQVKPPTPYVPPPLYPRSSIQAIPAQKNLSRSRPTSLQSRLSREDHPRKIKRLQTADTKLAELRNKVQALEAVASKEEAGAMAGTELTEEDLVSIYEDLLDNPPAPVQEEIVVPSQEEDLEFIQAASERLTVTQTLADDSLSRTLIQMQERLESNMEDISDASSPPHSRLLLLVRQFVDRLPLMDSAEEMLVVSPLSHREWQALTRACIRSTDTGAADSTLQLIKQCRIPGPLFSETLDVVLSYHAKLGNVTYFENTLTTFAPGTHSEEHRHLRVKAYLRSHPRDEIPTRALTVLHSYESENIPPPMKTYAKLITALFSIRSSIAQAQAWDLFTHMRYVAHPIPSDVLYTMMIRACASPISPSLRSEPERAMDLWTEMVIEKEIPPTLGTYNAVILACARSAETIYVNEAFRLAREMMDSHRDAYGRPRFEPSRKTFCALLEGAKRLGDLGRTRWILAEMVKHSRWKGPEDAVNEEVMMHVFHAYTTYIPPFKRSLAPMQDSPSQDVPKSPQSTAVAGKLALDEEESPTFPHIPPQSREETLAEAQALFDQIVEEHGVSDGSFRKFQHVEITSRLVNSYLSVHYRHGKLETARELFWDIFEKLGVPRTNRSLAEALRRCAHASTRDKQLSLEFAEELMEKWRTLPEGSPRMIEQMYINYIQVLTKAGKLDRAMEQVKAFVARYPPSLLREPPPKPDFRGTRTSLAASRPMVRTTSLVEIPDDQVPPLLTFRDVQLLHHKFVNLEGDGMKEIAYLTGVCKSYEGSLKQRREKGLLLKPTVEPMDPPELDEPGS